MFNSYIEMLKAVDAEGELISPSDVSLNRSFATKELTNVQVKIDDYKQLLLDDNEVNYLEKELDWFLDWIEKPVYHVAELSHELQPPSKKPIISSYSKMLKDLGKDLLGCVNRAGPNSNYGEMCLRLKNHIGITQIEWVVERLTHDASSRQAVAFYNSPNYQYWSNQDFVCTLTQMFNIKNNKLNTTVNIRSNDLINCFRFDSIWYKIFQKKVLEQLKRVYPELQEGYLFCNIFSAHFYLKDEEKLDRIYSCDKENSFKKIGDRYL